MQVLNIVIFSSVHSKVLNMNNTQWDIKYRNFLNNQLQEKM